MTRKQRKTKYNEVLLGGVDLSHVRLSRGLDGVFHAEGAHGYWTASSRDPGKALARLFYKEIDQIVIDRFGENK